MIDVLQKAKDMFVAFILDTTKNLDFELAVKNNPIDMNGVVQPGKYEVAYIYHKQGTSIRSRIGYMILYPITTIDRALLTKEEDPIEKALRELSKNLLQQPQPTPSQPQPTAPETPASPSQQPTQPKIPNPYPGTLLDYATTSGNGHIISLDPAKFPIEMQDDPNKFADHRLRLIQDKYYQLQNDTIKAIGGNSEIGKFIFNILYTGEPRRDDNLRSQLSNLQFGPEAAVNHYWDGYDGLAQWIINGGKYALKVVNRQEWEPTVSPANFTIYVPIPNTVLR